MTQQPRDGRLFFVAADELHGFELWATDGTPAGTRMVRDILPGAASSLKRFFFDVEPAAGRPARHRL